MNQGETHQSGGCHCMLCSVRGGGWHGRHSVLRVAIVVGLILAAFCLGTAVGEHGGHRGFDRGEYGSHERGGYGEGRYMQGYGEYQGGMNQPNVMYIRQQVAPVGGMRMPMMGTTSVNAQ